MKRNYTTSIIQRGICLFLLVPLILGISISEMRASTQALYRAWDLNVYSMENMAWEYEVLENKEEREEKDKLEYYVSEVQSLKDRKSTRLNSSHFEASRMPSSA